MERNISSRQFLMRELAGFDEKDFHVYLRRTKSRKFFHRSIFPIGRGERGTEAIGRKLTG